MSGTSHIVLHKGIVHHHRHHNHFIYGNSLIHDCVHSCASNMDHLKMKRINAQHNYFMGAFIVIQIIIILLMELQTHDCHIPKFETIGHHIQMQRASTQYDIILKMVYH